MAWQGGLDRAAILREFLDMRALFLLQKCALLALWLCLCLTVDALCADLPPNQWTDVAPGLAVQEFSSEEGPTLLVLRIDPAQNDFVLGAASLDGRGARPLGKWAEEYNLLAAINASMYLPDGLTSTGYMRYGEHINNGRQVSRFGAFFVAGPDRDDLPRAALLDRESANVSALLPHYRLVVQNYRMTTHDGKILWAEGGPLYAISAVGQDAQGNILFLHCREPIEAYEFASHAMSLPLQLRQLMYVEGGGQAGLLLRTSALVRDVSGQSRNPLLVSGKYGVAVPNVIGVVGRE